MADGLARILYDAAGNAIKIVQDGSDYLLGIASKLRNVSGTLINPATEDTLDAVKDNQESSVDSGNSSTSQLGDSGTFVGTGVDCIGYAGVAVTVHSDQDSAADGMKFQFSQDNSNWDDVYEETLVASENEARRFSFPVTARYFRVNYTNGTTTTTAFRVQTILHRNVLSDSAKIVRREDDVLDYIQGDELAQTKVVIYNPSGDPIGHQSGSPIYITPTAAADREFLAKFAIAVDLPASITSGNSEPFDVGGDTLTLTINGTSDNHTFPTRAATKGISFSAQNPPNTNGGEDELKVSIDGGAETAITVTQNLLTHELAAAIQQEIRDNVPNGTGVICEYNPTDFPGRYIIRSGTTGASSSVWVKDDKIGKILLLSVPSGGTQRDGLAADNYYAFEVADELETGTAGLLAQDDGTGKVYMETVELGSSASILVGSGGANVALGFSTTQVNGVAGTGSDDLAVDGSTTPVRYSITADPIRTYNIEKIKFLITDAGAQLKKFGGLDPLTNGVSLETRTAGGNLRAWFNAITNSEIFANVDEWDMMIDAFDGGIDLVVATIKFAQPVVLRPGSVESISVVVNDDLTALDEFQIRAEGWLEITT